MVSLKGRYQMTVQVPKEIYHEFKVACKRENVTISIKIRDLMKNYLIDLKKNKAE